MERPSVYIILLNWNGAIDTIECLESLRRCKYDNFHVVILDNASKDNSVKRLREYLIENDISFSEYIMRKDNFLEMVKNSIPSEKFLRSVKLIMSEENLGFCKGNNVGLKFSALAGADYILLLNNDTICEPDFLEPMVSECESNKNIGLAGGIICYAEEPAIVWWAGGKFDYFLETKRIGDGRFFDSMNLKEPFKTDWISGCMMLIPRRIYEEVGGLDEDYFIWSEEWDISLRVRARGYSLVVVPSSKIYHKIGKSLGVMVPLYYYYATRNRLLLKKKHLSRFLRFIYLFYFLPSRILRYGYFAMKGRFDLFWAGIYAIYDYFKGKTGKWDKHDRVF